MSDTTLSKLNYAFIHDGVANTRKLALAEKSVGSDTSKQSSLVARVNQNKYDPIPPKET